MSRERITSETILLLLAITTYFIIIQLIIRQFEPSIKRDSVGLLEQTIRWHKTHILVSEENIGSFVPPLALFIYRFPLAIGISLLLGIQIILLCFGTTVPILFFLVVREFCGKNKIALVSSALIASNPYLHDVFNSVLRDPIFIPLVLSALYLMLICYNDPCIITACAAGLFSGFAFLTRYEGVLLTFTFFFFMMLNAIKKHKLGKPLGLFLLFILIFLISVLIPIYIWGGYSIAWKVFLWRLSSI